MENLNDNKAQNHTTLAHYGAIFFIAFGIETGKVLI